MHLVDSLERLAHSKWVKAARCQISSQTWHTHYKDKYEILM